MSGIGFLLLFFGRLCLLVNGKCCNKSYRYSQFWISERHTSSKRKKNLIPKRRSAGFRFTRWFFLSLSIYILHSIPDVYRTIYVDSSKNSHTYFCQFFRESPLLTCTKFNLNWKWLVAVRCFSSLVFFLSKQSRFNWICKYTGRLNEHNFAFP